jgi:hypothetical protein
MYQMEDTNRKGRTLNVPHTGYERNTKHYEISVGEGGFKGILVEKGDHAGWGIDQRIFT